MVFVPGKRSLSNKVCAKINKFDEVIVWVIMFTRDSSKCILKFFTFVVMHANNL